MVTPELLESHLQQAGVPSDQIQLISGDYTSSKLQALPGPGPCVGGGATGLPLTRIAAQAALRQRCINDVANLTHLVHRHHRDIDGRRKGLPERTAKP